jgi:GDPmannose 4,6-dehydratase
MNPINAYGISKAAGVHLCKYFRTQHSLYASAGILYNHESPRRSARFLSKKVVQAAVKIKRGSQERLVLGDLDTLVDWGFAGDYVEAMWKILQLREPDDFVIATGILHSVRDFVTTAFEILDLEWSKYVIQSDRILTKRPATLCGDSTKLRRTANWMPETSFEEFIRMMIHAELNDAG